MTHRKSIMRTAASLISGVTAIIFVPSSATAADQVYEISRICAVVTSVAAEHNLLPPNVTPDRARALSMFYARRAAATRVPTDRIDHGQVTLRETIVRRLNSADAAVATKEKSDTIRMEQNCAAAMGLEMTGKAQPH